MLLQKRNVMRATVSSCVTLIPFANSVRKWHLYRVMYERALTWSTKKKFYMSHSLEIVPARSNKNKKIATPTVTPLRERPREMDVFRRGVLRRGDKRTYTPYAGDRKLVRTETAAALKRSRERRRTRGSRASIAGNVFILCSFRLDPLFISHPVSSWDKRNECFIMKSILLRGERLWRDIKCLFQRGISF